MKKVELESFLKSFIIFFVSIGVLISTIYYINYTKDIQKLDDKIFSQMRICSFDLECEEYEIDFVLTQGRELYRLYKEERGLLSYFPISNSVENTLEISLSLEKYAQSVKHLQSDALSSLSLIMLFVLFLSTIFAIYTLYPLRNALRLTEEFIKDILHDINTPLSTLRLNSSMLEKEFGENQKITRIQKSVQTILNLQVHLRSYLNNTPSEKEEIELRDFIAQRISILQMNYEKISFTNSVEKRKILTNVDAFTRIIDNILSNAVKYNKERGSVEVYSDRQTKTLFIKDSGKGIANPQKIFDRFYKEQDRGIGIGMHIVQKLSKELDIPISVETKIGVGTIISLEIR